MVKGSEFRACRADGVRGLRVRDLLVALRKGGAIGSTLLRGLGLWGFGFLGTSIWNNYHLVHWGGGGLLGFKDRGFEGLGSWDFRF